MNQELALRRKWTFRAHGRQVVFEKKSLESNAHVFTKALLWALFLPEYPGMSVEIRVGQRYKPDLVQLDGAGRPVFWGEAGRVGLKKMRTLINRFRSTHLVFGKWDMNLTPFSKIIAKEAGAVSRSAPVELVSFPSGIDERAVARDGTIQISFDDVTRLRF